MPPKKLYFVRHGEADYNLLDRVNSHPDKRNNLTSTGREQAACCGKELAGTGIEIIYCSEFPRARQTAEIINQQFGVAVVVDPLTNETGAFAFEGQPARLWHEAQVPDRLNAMVSGCEPFIDMKRRLAEFLAKLHAVSAQRIAIVSHEEPIQVMTGILEGMPDAVARTRPISHCLPVCLPLRITARKAN